MSKLYETIKIDRDQSIITVTINRPHRLNAINEVILKELNDILEIIDEDQSLRCVIITGEGDRSFSVGADVTMFSKATPVKATEFSINGQKIFNKIEDLSKPIIAAINGFALGGGLELALACDFRIAVEHTELGTPEILLGLIPGWGGTQRLVRIVGVTKAKEMIMLGEKLTASEALKYGLVNKVVPYDKLQLEAKSLALKLCAGPPIALKYAKNVINLGLNPSLRLGLRLESALMGLTFSTEDIKEGLEAFMAKKKANFKGE